MAEQKKFEPEMCSNAGCKNEARATVAIVNGKKGDHFVVYIDNREAPKGAIRYCKGHTVALVAGLANDLIDGDD